MAFKDSTKGHERSDSDFQRSLAVCGESTVGREEWENRRFYQRFDELAVEMVRADWILDSIASREIEFGNELV